MAITETAPPAPIPAIAPVLRPPFFGLEFCPALLLAPVSELKGGAALEDGDVNSVDWGMSSDEVTLAILENVLEGVLKGVEEVSATKNASIGPLISLHSFQESSPANVVNVL